MRTCAIPLLCFFLILSRNTARSADDDAWNLPAAERVKEAESAASRGDISTPQRVLQQMETAAKATGTLTEQASAEARVHRVRLALARAMTRVGQWDKALPILLSIPLEGKTPGIQKAICAATLEALKSVLISNNSRIVTPWMPIANDKFGPHQPNESLRAPYTRIDRAKAPEQIAATLASWERLAKESADALTESERSTTAALDPITILMCRYAWGIAPRQAVEDAIQAIPEAQRSEQALRFARLLMDERDLKRAVPRLIEIAAAKNESTFKSAVEELLRISCACDRVKTSLPMLDPGVSEAIKPYVNDPVWAPIREKIVREFDESMGTVDLSIVLGEPYPDSMILTLNSVHGSSSTAGQSSELSDIVVPPEILAKAELGDHFETINTDSPDTHALEARIKQLTDDKKEPLTDEEKKELTELQKVKKELDKLAGKKPSRYRKLGILAGVLRGNLLLKLDPRIAGLREQRDEFELQVDHQEFLIEALGPPDQKDISSGFRPLTSRAPLRLMLLTHYHGDLEVEARKLPDRAGYDKLDASVSPEFVQTLPLVKTFTIHGEPLARNLEPDPAKRIVEIKDHGLASGFYVLLARARYSPVVSTTRLAVTNTKIIIRHLPGEVLVWTLDRLTGTPVPHTKLVGDLNLEYIAANVWGDTPIPAGKNQTALNKDQFLFGLGDTLNDRAQQIGDDSYLVGVAEGRKLREKFPPDSKILPAESDENGLVRIPLPESWRGHNCHIRATANGCDVDAIDSTALLQNDTHERVVEWVADRPVVRPGGSVRLQGFVRENIGGHMSPAHGGEVALRLYTESITLFDSTVPIGPDGACVFEQLIDPDTLDGAVFAMTPSSDPEQKKNQTKQVCMIKGGEAASKRIRIELPAHPVPAGGRIKARAIVESIAGTPLAGVPVVIGGGFNAIDWRQSIPLTEVLNQSANKLGLVGDNLPAWNFSQELTSGTQGEVEFEIEIPEGRDAIGFVHAQVRGGLRSAVTATGKILSCFSPCIWHVESALLPPPGKPGHLVVSAQTLDGSAYTGAFEIADSKKRIIAKLTPDKDGKGAADLQIDTRKELFVRPENRAHGDWRVVNFLESNGESTEQRGRVLEAHLDRPNYKLGETARLSLRADRANLTVLLTTETSGITRAQILKMPARNLDVDILIGDQDAPNSTVALTVLADDLVECVMLPLDVAKTERDLNVVTETSAATVEPGQTVTLTTRVTDAHNKPVPDADVVLVAYDSRLLEFSDHDDAAEFGKPFLAASRAPHDAGWVTGYESFNYGCGFIWQTPEWSYGPYVNDSRMLTAPLGTGVGSDAGWGHGSFGMRNGGGRRLMVRRYGGSRATIDSRLHTRTDFSEQALWLTTLRTDAAGNVSAQFTLPDSITTFHVVAYVLDKRGYPGTGTTNVTVHRDIEVSLELPAEFREGDQTEVSLTVQNATEKKQAVKLSVEMPLPVISARLAGPKASGPLPESIDLEPHSTALVRYRLNVVQSPLVGPEKEQDSAIELGQMLSFKISASSPGGAILDQAIVQAPLRYSGQPVREVTQAVLHHNGTLHVPYSGTFDSGHTSLSITLHRGLKGLALQVRDLQYVFPEHCLEQTLSRLVPAVVLAEAASDTVQAESDRTHLQSVLRSGVTRLRTLQDSLGGELIPLAAWYLRELSSTSAGQNVLSGDRDWKTLASNCELIPGLPRETKLEEWRMPDTAKSIPAAYGGFREDLWNVFGASQQIHGAKSNLAKREFRTRFNTVCESVLVLARGRKLAPQDRALAALLFATLNRGREAMELLALRSADVVPAIDIVRRQGWSGLQTPILTDSLELLAMIELKRPESEILRAALKLEGQTLRTSHAYGTTFLNGITLLALAKTLKLSGAAPAAKAGPIVLKLNGKPVLEVAAGMDLRRMTLNRGVVESGFHDGWDFSIEAPEGASVGLAVQRSSLLPEIPRELTAKEVRERCDSLESPPQTGENAPRIQFKRAMFVREPGQKDVGPREGWHPYAGQPVPRGTELLVATVISDKNGLEFTQIDLPVLHGWDAELWNESDEVYRAALDANVDSNEKQNTRAKLKSTPIQTLMVQPGLLDFTAFLNKTDNTKAAAMLELIRKRQWATVSSPIDLNKLICPAVFSFRANYFALTPFSRKTHGGADYVQGSGPRAFVQCGVLNAEGRYRLPGARAWDWYDPSVDVTASADLIQVGGKNASVIPPTEALNSQEWLEKSWRMLAQNGWAPKPPYLFETTGLNEVTISALSQSATPEAGALLQEYPSTEPKIQSLEDLRRVRNERYESYKSAGIENASVNLRHKLLLPLTSWEGLKAEAAASGIVSKEPLLTMAALRQFAEAECNRATELLPYLPEEDRPQAVDMKRHALREYAELLFASGDSHEALKWVWSQFATDVIDGQVGTLDELVEMLRTEVGLDIRIDPRAPLVLSAPLIQKDITLLEYFERSLAECEIQTMQVPGRGQLLQWIGHPAGSAPLTIKEAMELPVYFVRGNDLSVQIHNALTLRGIQFVAPPFTYSETSKTVLPLKTWVNLLAQALKRGVRIEENIIELK